MATDLFSRGDEAKKKTSRQNAECAGKGNLSASEPSGPKKEGRKVPWDRLRPSEALKHRYVTEILIIWLITLGTCIALCLLYVKWGIAFHISHDTQHYLYSSLTQAFAALAGLLIAATAFSYERVRERQNVYLEDALREAKGLGLHDIPQDCKTIRDRLNDWSDKSHIENVGNVERQMARFKKESDEPGRAEYHHNNRKQLSDRVDSLRNDVDRHRLIAGSLTNVNSLDRHVTDITPTKLILAIGSTLVVIGMSTLLLTFSDHLGDLHAYAAVATISAAGFSTAYIVSFIRSMLDATYGRRAEPDYVGLELKELERANKVISDADQILKSDPKKEES